MRSPIAEALCEAQFFPPGFPDPLTGIMQTPVGVPAPDRRITDMPLDGYDWLGYLIERLKPLVGALPVKEHSFHYTIAQINKKRVDYRQFLERLHAREYCRWPAALAYWVEWLQSPRGTAYPGGYQQWRRYRFTSDFAFTGTFNTTVQQAALPSYVSGRYSGVLDTTSNYLYALDPASRVQQRITHAFFNNLVVSEQGYDNSPISASSVGMWLPLGVVLSVDFDADEVVIEQRVPFALDLSDIDLAALDGIPRRGFVLTNGSFGQPNGTPIIYTRAEQQGRVWRISGLSYLFATGANAVAGYTKPYPQAIQQLDPNSWRAQYDSPVWIYMGAVFPYLPALGGVPVKPHTGMDAVNLTPALADPLSTVGSVSTPPSLPDSVNWYAELGNGVFAPNGAHDYCNAFSNRVLPPGVYGEPNGLALRNASVANPPARASLQVLAESRLLAPATVAPFVVDDRAVADYPTRNPSAVVNRPTDLDFALAGLNDFASTLLAMSYTFLVVAHQDKRMLIDVLQVFIDRAITPACVIATWEHRDPLNRPYFVLPGGYAAWADAHFDFLTRDTITNIQAQYRNTVFSFDGLVVAYAFGTTPSSDTAELCVPVSYINRRYSSGAVYGAPILNPARWGAQLSGGSASNQYDDLITYEPVKDGSTLKSGVFTLAAPTAAPSAFALSAASLLRAKLDQPTASLATALPPVTADTWHLLADYETIYTAKPDLSGWDLTKSPVNNGPLSISLTQPVHLSGPFIWSVLNAMGQPVDALKDEYLIHAKSINVASWLDGRAGISPPSTIVATGTLTIDAAFQGATDSFDSGDRGPVSMTGYGKRFTFSLDRLPTSEWFLPSDYSKYPYLGRTKATLNASPVVAPTTAPAPGYLPTFVGQTVASNSYQLSVRITGVSGTLSGSLIRQGIPIVEETLHAVTPRAQSETPTSANIYRGATSALRASATTAEEDGCYFPDSLGELHAVQPPDASLTRLKDLGLFYLRSPKAAKLELTLSGSTFAGWPEAAFIVLLAEGRSAIEFPMPVDDVCACFNLNPAVATVERDNGKLYYKPIAKGWDQIFFMDRVNQIPCTRWVYVASGPSMVPPSAVGSVAGAPFVMQTPRVGLQTNSETVLTFLPTLTEVYLRYSTGTAARNIDYAFTLGTAAGRPFAFTPTVKQLTFTEPTVSSATFQTDGILDINFSNGRPVGILEARIVIRDTASNRDWVILSGSDSFFTQTAAGLRLSYPRSNPLALPDGAQLHILLVDPAGNSRSMVAGPVYHR